jgi:hypothetical protein
MTKKWKNSLSLLDHPVLARGEDIFQIIIHSVGTEQGSSSKHTSQPLFQVLLSFLLFSYFLVEDDVFSDYV